MTPPPQPGVVLRSRLSVIDCAEYQRSTVSWTASGPRQSSARWRAFVSVWSRDLAHARACVCACVCVQFGATRNLQTPLADAVGLHAPLVSVSLGAVGGGKANGHRGSCPSPASTLWCRPCLSYLSDAIQTNLAVRASRLYCSVPLAVPLPIITHLCQPRS